MKKEYIIGLLTGCLLTASALIFVGATDGDADVGRYKIFWPKDNFRKSMVNVHIHDTKTGVGYTRFYDSNTKALSYSRHSYKLYEKEYTKLNKSE